MKRIHVFGRALQLVLLSALIASALGLSVIRLWLIPRAAQYKAWLATQLGAQLGGPVHIGRLAARMRGFEPVVVLHDVQLLDPEDEHPALSFRELRIQLDLPRTLLAKQPLLRRVTLAGSQLTVWRDRQGRLALLGLSGQESQSGWLFAQGRIELTGVEWSWRDDVAGDGAAIRLGRGDVVLENNGHQHDVRASFALSESLGKRLRMAASLIGDPALPDLSEGRVYLEGAALNPAIFSLMGELPLTLKTGTVDLSIWGDWQAGRLQGLAGRLTADKPVLAHRGEGKSESVLGLHRMEGAFRWQGLANGGLLNLNHLRLALFDQAVPTVNLALAYETSATTGEPLVRAAADRVVLDDLRVVFDALPLFGAEARAWSRELAMRGELRNLKLFHAPGERQWAVCTDFSGLGTRPWRGAPGVSGWAGSVCGDEQKGRIELAVRGGAFDFPVLWPKPLPIDSLAGTVRWHQQEQVWDWTGDGLALAAPGLNLSGRFRLENLSAESPSPFLDLRAELHDVQALAIRDYLPLNAMPRLSATWLSEAFDGGVITHADVLFHGWVQDYPFAKGEGVFQANAWADKLELDFDSAWPHAFDVAGQVRFQGRGMEIDVSDGRIGGARLRQVHAGVDDLVRRDWLAIDGAFETTLPQSMEYLRQTPLRHIPERLQKVAVPGGDADVTLSLQVPITEGITEVKVDGRARLRDAVLELTAIDHKLSHIQGDLYFDNAGLRARRMQASFLEEPITVDIEQRAGDILIDTSGHVAAKTLTQVLPFRAGKKLSGKSDYHLEMAIPETMEASSRPLRLRLDSDLIGMAVALPEPLGKVERARKDLRVDLSAQQREKSLLNLSYGGDLKARLALKETPEGFALAGGEIAIGKPLPASGGESGLRLWAYLPELDLSAWRKVMGENADTAQATLPEPVAFDISADRCFWQERDLGRFAVAAERSSNGWSGTVDSDYGRGQFEWIAPPFGKTKLALDLETLKWPKLTPKLEVSGFGELDPNDLPALRVRSKQTLWKGNSVGVLSLDSEQWTQGLNISSFEIRSDNHHMKLKGRWMHAGEGIETALDGGLEVKDMGRFVAELGYGREIRDTPANLKFKLQWPGGPLQFSANQVAGDVDMKLGKGRLPQVEPGLGRILGMLDLDNLSRRLRLDFSDMFAKGLTYDRIIGRFALADGQARTESFLIDALAANIFVSGRAGLVAKDLDMRIAVVPHTSVTLPIAGTLAGGPAVGAAVLLAQQLVGNQVDSITSSHYTVTGTWDNPKVSNQPGYMPMDMLNRAWTGLKNISGFGEQEEEQ